ADKAAPPPCGRPKLRLGRLASSTQALYRHRRAAEMLTAHPAVNGTFPAYSVFAENLYSLVEDLHPPCARFVLLVAADTVDISATDLHGRAGRALACGATYVCCWGPGAERLHDAVDLAANDRETDESRGDEVSVIM